MIWLILNAMVKEANTEKKILDAAEEVFIKKGMDGTRMQEIADVAGINKSLLHYYYRSKDKLFGAVFKKALKAFIPKVEMIVTAETDIYSKIRTLVENYISILIKHPYIPMFIMKEINRNPDLLYEVFLEVKINPELILKAISDEMDKGTIRKMSPKHFIINILSLCIFPVAAKPLLQRILFNNDKKAYQEFIEERKTLVADQIIHVIKP